MVVSSWFAVVQELSPDHRRACVLWSGGTTILVVGVRRFKRFNLLRSDDTEARNDILGCFGRSHRRAQRQPESGVSLAGGHKTSLSPAGPRHSILVTLRTLRNPWKSWGLTEGLPGRFLAGRSDQNRPAFHVQRPSFGANVLVFPGVSRYFRTLATDFGRLLRETRKIRRPSRPERGRGSVLCKGRRWSSELRIRRSGSLAEFVRPCRFFVRGESLR
jgi:hypothetical protein